MNPLRDPEDLDEATTVINRYASSDWCKIAFADHALDRLDQRIIPNDVVMMALREGGVVGVRQKVTKSNKLIYSYEVEFRDQYGRVTVITAVPGPFRLTVVSAYTDIPD